MSNVGRSCPFLRGPSSCSLGWVGARSTASVTIRTSGSGPRERCSRFHSVSYRVLASFADEATRLRTMPPGRRGEWELNPRCSRPTASISCCECHRVPGWGDTIHVGSCVRILTRNCICINRGHSGCEPSRINITVYRKRKAATQKETS